MARERHSPYWWRRQDRARLRSARNGKRPGGKPAGMCVDPGCTEGGMACWLPDYYDTGGTRPDAYYCGKHIEGSGFCKGCGSFSGGIESFDYALHGYPGYCDNCAFQLQAEDTVWYDAYDYDDYDDDRDDRVPTIVIVGGWPEEVFAP